MTIIWLLLRWLCADIRSHSPSKPVLVFVSSRRQTRLTALDLVAMLALEGNPKQWLHMPEAEVRFLCKYSIFNPVLLWIVEIYLV